MELWKCKDKTIENWKKTEFFLNEKKKLKEKNGKKSLQILLVHTNVCWTTNSIEEGITKKQLGMSWKWKEMFLRFHKKVANQWNIEKLNRKGKWKQRWKNEKKK